MLLVCNVYVVYASLSSWNADVYTTDNNIFVGTVYILYNMARVYHLHCTYAFAWSPSFVMCCKI